MADPDRSPVSVCERCPYDTRLCLADNWRGAPDAGGRVELNFRCPLIELRFEAIYSGLGPWHVTDLGGERGTVAIADGRLTPPREAMTLAAETFQRRGYFHRVSKAEVVDSMAKAYRAATPNDPILPRLRDALAHA